MYKVTKSLHSHCAVPRQINVSMSFWDVLHSFENQSMWKYFSYDGDGKWIHRELMMGSLVMVHDGSYMPKVTKKVCSAAFYIYCKTTKQRCRGAAAEHSTNANNYRAEILGGIMIQLVLIAASQQRLSP